MAFTDFELHHLGSAVAGARVGLANALLRVSLLSGPPLAKVPFQVA